MTTDLPPLTPERLAEIRASIGTRYIVVPQSEAPDDGDWMRHRADADWLNCVVREAADGTRTTIGWDGGEPEDQTLGRDWDWVAPTLSAVEKRRDADVSALLAEIERHALTPAEQDVLAERQKQQAKWGDAHDDGHGDGALAAAAALLASSVPDIVDAPEWAEDLRAKLCMDRRAQLVAAAALLLAEVERIDRLVDTGSK